uniref:(northern house mosquito) hypothetical protein n=1 Tax=Culex pipiens TaxID=7175 RepID=A0A8D8H8A4_CULPI
MSAIRHADHQHLLVLHWNRHVVQHVHLFQRRKVLLSQTVDVTAADTGLPAGDRILHPRPRFVRWAEADQSSLYRVAERNQRRRERFLRLVVLLFAPVRLQPLRGGDPDGHLSQRSRNGPAAAERVNPDQLFDGGVVALSWLYLILSLSQWRN